MFTIIQALEENSLGRLVSHTLAIPVFTEAQLAIGYHLSSGDSQVSYPIEEKPS